jgi:hypothetical protein
LADFGLWFETGLTHIADWQAYDHILFLLALCGIYTLSEWKTLLWLVTAFTLGHTLTLALAVLGWVNFSASWIEFLIPLTIVLSCLYNIVGKQSIPKNKTIPYLMALVFGLVHGLGFSFLLRAMLGRSAELVGPLFAFNLGIEVGQLIIVALVVLLGLLFTRFIGVKAEKWSFFLSSAVFGIAFIMMLERFPL